MPILGRGNSLYYDSTDLFHLPVLIFGADAAREVARQPIVVLKLLDVIAEAGGSAFNRIVWKRGEMGCILFNDSKPDSQKK